MKSFVTVLVMLVVYTTLFGVGCWEASMADQHSPTSDSSPGVLQGYVYTILAACLNIVTSILLMCLFIMSDRNSEKNESSGVSLAMLLAIWGIVLFAGMVDGNIRTGPFQPVVIAQFCITMVGLSLCCCSCCLLGILTHREPAAPAAQRPTTNVLTEQPVQVVVQV